jgi:hypothetical protein
VITLPISILGSQNYFYITSEGISYKPLCFSKKTLYSWSDIKEIDIESFHSGGTGQKIEFKYELITADNTHIDIGQDSLMQLLKSYDTIYAYLSKQPHLLCHVRVDDAVGSMIDRRYDQGTAAKIRKVFLLH